MLDRGPASVSVQNLPFPTTVLLYLIFYPITGLQIRDQKRHLQHDITFVPLLSHDSRLLSATVHLANLVITIHHRLEHEKTACRLGRSGGEKSGRCDQENRGESREVRA